MSSTTEFHVITIGQMVGEDEFEDYFIAPVDMDARQIMAGKEPYAICASLQNATLIVNALNQYRAA